jgi:uncharacterized protein
MEKYINQTENWIKSVVIGCNFCPFAAKALLQKSIRYVVLEKTNIADVLETLLNELRFLDANEEIETTFIIFPNHYKDFEQYLDLVEIAEDLNVEEDYEGIYQIASFHPDYCFAGVEADQSLYLSDVAYFKRRKYY